MALAHRVAGYLCHTSRRRKAFIKMSAVKSNVLAPPLGWTTSLVLVRSVRTAQFVFTIVTLGLVGSATHHFWWDGATPGYGVATSVLSLVYLICIFLGTWFAGPYFMAGPLLISEIVLLILWVSAFIALGVQFGNGTCAKGIYRYYSPGPCKTAQASIAMSGVSMLLYAISLSLLVVNSVRPIIVSYGSPYLWSIASEMNATFDRGTGLILSATTAPMDEPEIINSSDKEIGQRSSQHSECLGA